VVKYLIPLLLVLSSVCVLEAQPLQRPRNPDDPGTYSSKVMRRSSLILTVGSGYVNGGPGKIYRPGLGELGYAWSFTRRWDAGLSMYGSLMCNEAERQADGSIRYEGADADECTGAWIPGRTLMATGRYYPVDDLAIYAQGGAGYALDASAPAYTVCIGGSHRFVERIAIVGLVRWSGLVPLSTTPDWLHPAGGLRLEVGLFWHYRS
jgi:hypothetical protein